MPKHIKKYWWGRLKDSFFDRKDIKLLRHKGYEHVYFFMNLLCLSYEYEGDLRQNGIPLKPEELAVLIDISPEQMKESIEEMMKLNLVEKKNGCIRIVNFEEYLARESSIEADIEIIQRSKRRQMTEKKTSNDVESNSNRINTNQEKEEYLLYLQGDEIYYVTQEDISMYESSYPSVNVKKELNRMKAWTYSNDKKRKTKSGIKRFINNWLNDSQKNQKSIKNESEIQFDFSSVEY